MATQAAPPALPQAPAPEVPAVPPRDFDHFLGDTFTHGTFEYRIRSLERRTSIGNRFAREETGSGSTFLLVHYTETNRGSETVTGTEGPMQLRDQAGRTFRPSSRAMTSLAMSGRGDLLITELHPGVGREATVAFEIPADPNQRLILLVQERGLFGTGEHRVLLRTEAQERGANILDQVVYDFAAAATSHDTAAVRSLLSAESAGMSDDEINAMMDDYAATSGAGRAYVNLDSVVEPVDDAWHLELSILNDRDRPTGNKITYEVVDTAGRYRLRRVTCERRSR